MFGKNYICLAMYVQCKPSFLGFYFFSRKFILKEAFKDYFPDSFLDKSKKGFGVPVGDWLRGTLRKEFISYTDKKFIQEQGIFEYENISQLVYNHLNGKEDATFKMWPFYCFQKWYKNIYLN